MPDHLNWYLLRWILRLDKYFNTRSLFFGSNSFLIGTNLHVCSVPLCIHLCSASLRIHQCSVSLCIHRYRVLREWLQTWTIPSQYATGFFFNKTFFSDYGDNKRSQPPPHPLHIGHDRCFQLLFSTAPHWPLMFMPPIGKGRQLCMDFTLEWSIDYITLDGSLIIN